MQSIRAAAVQLNHLPGDKAANLEKIERFAAEAAARDVELLTFPEMCISGYWHVRHLDRGAVEALSEPVPGGPSTRRLVDLAAAHGLTLGAGLVERGEDGALYNTYVVALPDGRTVRHRKLHCFISPHMASGGEYTVFDLPSGVRAGILICYDNNLGENVRITALRGAQVLLAPHQTGGCHSPKRGGEAMTARAKKSAAVPTPKPTAARSARSTAVPRPPRKKRVTLVAPIADAGEVVATGDFLSGWSAEGVRLKRRRDDSWSATLQLSPGSYEYRLLVDGQWWNNPACEHRSGNPFGSENDVLIVT